MNALQSSIPVVVARPQTVVSNSLRSHMFGEPVFPPR